MYIINYEHLKLNCKNPKLFPSIRPYMCIYIDNLASNFILTTLCVFEECENGEWKDDDEDYDFGLAF